MEVRFLCRFKFSLSIFNFQIFKFQFSSFNFQQSDSKKEEGFVAKPSSFMLIEYFRYSFGALSINSMNWSSFGVMII